MLSDRYPWLDIFDLPENVLPILQRLEGARFESEELTDAKMYFKVITPASSSTSPRGDIEQAGIVITNSEMSCGTLSVQPLIFRLVRRNGLIASDHALRKTHVGRAANTEAESTQIFRDDTLAEHDRTFFLKVRDVVEAAVSETTFLQVAQKLQRPGEVVEVLANRYTVNDTERAGMMRHLIVEGDLTAYGNGQRRHALLVERRRLRPSARKPAALRDFCPLTEVLPSPGAASRLPGHFFGCQQCRRLHRRSLGGSTCGDHGSR